MSSGSLAVDINKIRKGQRSPHADSVAVEEPLEIRLGFGAPDGRATKSISITMRTPGNDDELAAGFLYTESIISSANDIASIDPCGPPAPDSGNHNVIRIELQPSIDVDLGRLQRHFYTTSSCGVCGKASLDALRVTGLDPLADKGPVFSEDVLVSLPDKLRAAQNTFDDTGGLHAAGAFDTDGKLIAVLEDVGRHNAVDKVIGRLLLEKKLPATKFGMMVSGQAKKQGHIIEA